jgi:hypothetical protein
MVVDIPYGIYILLGNTYLGILVEESSSTQGIIVRTTVESRPGHSRNVSSAGLLALDVCSAYVSCN